jgi:diguanylate cyclase (GGDEF)-like protein/PAS domain S-box-containing protein
MPIGPVATSLAEANLQQLPDLFQKAPLPVVFCAGLEVAYANDAFSCLLGEEGRELNGTSLLDWIPDRLQEDIKGVFEKAQADNAGLSLCTQLRRADQSTVEVEITGWATDALQESCLQLLVRDITVQKDLEAEQRRIASEKEITDLIRHAPVGIYRSTADGKLLLANSALAELFGYRTIEELLDRNVEDQPVQRSGRENFKRTLANVGKVQNYQSVWVRTDGSEITVREHARVVKDDMQNVLYYEGVVEDVTEQVRLQDELNRLAHHDPLTGVPNALLWRSRLERALIRADQQQKRLAILSIDLDRFKLVNNLFGHERGDLFFKAIVQRMAGSIRKKDTFARLEGDEFKCLVEELGPASMGEEVAERIVESLAHPITIDGRQMQASVSIGIALFPDDGRTADELSRNADRALHESKAAGRNQYRRFAGLEAGTRINIIEEGLARALQENAFHLEYQPQYSADRKLQGFEALLRFHHPTLGPLSPAEFIPIAEHCGLIVPIGNWVITEACKTGAAWKRQGLAPITICVNVSAVQFQRSSFADIVADVLERTGMPANMLELELTESVIMSDVKDSALQMERLKRIGVRIAIDDFGTGYSSLSYLHQLPFDTLKIDRSFIDKLSASSDTRPIVAAIIALARALSVKTIAEGVETEAQKSELCNLRCDLFQGYLFARPLPIVEAEKLLPLAG